MAVELLDLADPRKHYYEGSIALGLKGVRVLPKLLKLQ